MEGLDFNPQNELQGLVPEEMMGVTVRLRYLEPRKSGSKDAPYCVQIAHSVNRIRLEITSFRPLIPGIDRKNSGLVAMLVKIVFRLLKGHLKKLGSVISQNRSKRVLRLYIFVGLAGSRTWIPSDTHVHVIRYTKQVPRLGPITLGALGGAPVFTCGEGWERIVVYPRIRCDALYVQSGQELLHIVHFTDSRSHRV